MLCVGVYHNFVNFYFSTASYKFTYKATNVNFEKMFYETLYKT